MTFTRSSTLILFALSVLIALGSLRFIVVGLEEAFGDGFLHHIEARRVMFVLHVGMSPIALAIGAVQFLPKFRAQSINRHRWIGRTYALSILLGGISGMVLAIHMTTGLVASVGFFLLAMAWLVSTGIAVKHAIAREISQHREWMIRSFALTLSAVTLRIYLSGFFAAGYEYEVASPWLGWICWVPNLIVAEWWIRRSRENVMKRASEVESLASS